MIERIGYGSANLEIESDETSLMDIVQGLYTPLVAFHDTDDVHTAFANMKTFLLISQRFIYAQLEQYMKEIKS